jgi:hypothetical protein
LTRVLRAVVLALAACALVMFAATARADLTAQDHDRARALLASGRAKRAANDNRGALEDLQAAHAIEHLPTTGFEVGKTLVALGRLVEARELLLEIAKAPPNAGEPPPLAAARTDARELVDALERRIPTITIKLSAPPEPAVTATIDGAPAAIDLLGQPRRLNPGEHVIALRSARGTEERLPLTLREGETREVIMMPPRDGPVTTPLPRPDPAPPPTPGPVEPPEGRSHVIAWIGGAVGVVALGTGAVTGLVASGKTSDLEPRCPQNSCPPPTHDDLHGAQTMALVSTISFVVVGVAAAVVVWDLVRSPGAKTARTTAPFAGTF